MWADTDEETFLIYEESLLCQLYDFDDMLWDNIIFNDGFGF